VIQLYEFALSGNCHKVRLMMSLLELAYESVPVDGSLREHKSPAFMAINPFGQVPVFRDGDIAIRDSQAILVFLAHRYGGRKWWPDDSGAIAAIHSWLSTTAGEVTRGPNALRLHHNFGRAIDLEMATQTTHTLLEIMEGRLTTQNWIATDSSTIADIALYPYIALAPEGQVDLSPYPAVLAWIKRIQELPGYVGMPGM